MLVRKLSRLSLVIALVPALAIGAPKKKRTKKTKAPVTTPLPLSTPADPSATPTAQDVGATTPATTPTAAPTTPTTPTGSAASSSPSSTPSSSSSSSSGAPAMPSPGSTTTAPAEPRSATTQDIGATTADPDVDTLRQEYLTLRDELFKSRARANTVASQLYSTRIQIKLTYTTARFYSPAKASIRLDGATVYEDASAAIGGDDGVRFDGYVAPGRHLVTFRVEATGKDDDSFTSATEAQIVVKAVAGKDLIVFAKAKDAGDIAYEWKRKEKGSYGLGIDVAVKTVARAAEAGAKK